MGRKFDDFPFQLAVYQLLKELARPAIDTPEGRNPIIAEALARRAHSEAEMLGLLRPKAGDR